MKKKEIIRKTAIRLFNEKGYTNVSLREIAKESETTIGNLTYHYPQKEDLLIGIVSDLHTEFLIQPPKKIHRAELLSHLLNSFLNAERNQKENEFYYRNIYVLSLDSEEITQKNKQFQQILFEYYIEIFKTLVDDGVLKNSMTECAMQSLAYSIITINAVWMQSNSPNNNDELPTIRVSRVLSELLRPFVTEEYEKEFELLCNEKEIEIN